MAGIGLLHRIDRKRANSVYAKTIEQRVSVGSVPMHIQLRANTGNCFRGHFRLAVIWKSVIRDPSEIRRAPFQERVSRVLGSNFNGRCPARLISRYGPKTLSRKTTARLRTSATRITTAQWKKELPPGMNIVLAPPTWTPPAGLNSRPAPDHRLTTRSQ